MSIDEELDRLIRLDAPSSEEPTRKKGGRPPGATNKWTRTLKEAMFIAAENSEHAIDPLDPTAPGSVSQFLTTVANRSPEKFAVLLMKFVPQQYHMQKTELRAEVTYSSADEIKRALAEEGFSPKHIEMLEQMLPVTAAAVSNDGDEDE